MTQLIARALCFIPSKKPQAPAFPISKLGLPRPLCHVTSGSGRKEGYHLPPALTVPTGLGLGLAPLQHGGDFLGPCKCHFLTCAAVGVLWSQVPV